MSKFLRWFLVGIAVVLLDACGGGLPSNSVANNGTDPLPTVYGYDYIYIMNNANSSEASIKGTRDMWKHVAGYKVATVNRDVHCTDYQYSEGDKSSDNTVNGIRMMQYVIGNTICTETDYQEGPAPVRGNDTIVVGIE